MKLVIRIEQADNGWIVTYDGHDCLPKAEVYTEWDKVLVCIEKYFYQGSHRR